MDGTGVTKGEREKERERGREREKMRERVQNILEVVENRSSLNFT